MSVIFFKPDQDQTVKYFNGDPVRSDMSVHMIDGDRTVPELLLHTKWSWSLDLFKDRFVRIRHQTVISDQYKDQYDSPDQILIRNTVTRITGVPVLEHKQEVMNELLDRVSLVISPDPEQKTDFRGADTIWAVPARPGYHHCQTRALTRLEQVLYFRYIRQNLAVLWTRQDHELFKQITAGFEFEPLPCYPCALLQAELEPTKTDQTDWGQVSFRLHIDSADSDSACYVRCSRKVILNKDPQSKTVGFQHGPGRTVRIIDDPELTLDPEIIPWTLKSVLTHFGVSVKRILDTDWNGLWNWSAFDHISVVTGHKIFVLTDSGSMCFGDLDLTTVKSIWVNRSGQVPMSFQKIKIGSTVPFGIQGQIKIGSEVPGPKTNMRDLSLIKWVSDKKGGSIGLYTRDQTKGILDLTRLQASQFSTVLSGILNKYNT